MVDEHVREPRAGTITVVAPDVGAMAPDVYRRTASSPAGARWRRRNDRHQPTRRSNGTIPDHRRRRLHRLEPRACPRGAREPSGSWTTFGRTAGEPGGHRRPNRDRRGDLRMPRRWRGPCVGRDRSAQAALNSVPRSIKEPANQRGECGGTLCLLEAARQAGVRRVVYASSSSVYGESPALPKTEDLPLLPRRRTASRSWPPSSTVACSPRCTGWRR